MSGELDTLADARDALMPLGVPVLIAGDKDPGGDSVIVVQFISATNRPGYGLSDKTAKRLQVSCYGPNVQAAMQLEEQASALMLGAGFRLIQRQPAPEGAGMLTDWRR